MDQRLVSEWYERWFTPEVFLTGTRRNIVPEVTICDSTLREGMEEGRSCWSHMPDDGKIVQIAAALDGAGVGAIEMPSPSNETIKNYHEIERVIENAQKIVKVQLYLNDVQRTKDEIDLAVDIGRADRISNDDAGISAWFHGGSHEEYETLKRILCDVIDHAKKRYSIPFHATTSDFTRTPLERLLDFARSMRQAGADLIGLKDTFGTGNPTVIRELVSRLISDQPGFPIEIHCHDDMGLGVANSLSAVESGATWVDVCLNGLGDRAGHASLEQVVGILELSYGIRTGVDLTRLRQLSMFMQEETGLVFHTKALIGEGIFAEGRKRHLMQVISLKLRLLHKGSDKVEGIFNHLSSLLDSGKEFITEKDLEQAIKETEEGV